jgi:alkylhydroperoxidase family enzyme
VVRLRSANYHGCEFCQSVRRKVEWPEGTDDLMNEAMIGPASKLLDDRQKLALEALDNFVLAPAGLTAEMRTRLLDEFGASAIVELMLKEVFWMSNKPMISLGTDIGAVDRTTLTEFEYDADGNFALAGVRR